MRTLANYVIVGIAGAVLLTTGSLLALSTTGKIVAVQTNSMQPIFSAGDALFIKPAASYRVGDIITYHDQGTTTISHRIVAVTPDGYVTQGDAQRIPGRPIPRDLVIGRATAVAPSMGWPITALQTRVGLVFGCFVPAVLLLCREVWVLSRRLYRPTYRIDLSSQYR